MKPRKAKTKILSSQECSDNEHMDKLVETPGI
jgi:hypothetical protein